MLVDEETINEGDKSVLIFVQIISRSSRSIAMLWKDRCEKGVDNIRNRVAENEVSLLQLQHDKQ